MAGTALALVDAEDSVALPQTCVLIELIGKPEQEPGPFSQRLHVWSGKWGSCAVTVIEPPTT